MLAKHSKNFSLQDSIAIGVDRMRRNFEPMRRQTEQWRAQQISTATAKLVIYRAFIEGELQAPKHLARSGARSLFQPEVCGVSAAHDVEPVECIHIGIQGTGTDPAVQGHREARSIS